jgi:hypothetical protein
MLRGEASVAELLILVHFPSSTNNAGTLPYDIFRVDDTLNPKKMKYNAKSH